MVLKQFLINVILTVVVITLINLVICLLLEQDISYIQISIGTLLLILTANLPLFFLLSRTLSKSRPAIITAHLVPVFILPAVGFFSYRMSTWYSDDPNYVLILGLPFYLAQVFTALAVSFYSLFKSLKRLPGNL